MSSTGSGMRDPFPTPLKEAVRSEVLRIGVEERTRTFSVEYRCVNGVMKEARVRGRETLIIVPITS